MEFDALLLPAEARLQRLALALSDDPADTRTLAQWADWIGMAPRTLARLESNNQVLFWCQIGQLDGYYAMQVADPVDQKREFVDDILSR